MTNINSVQSSQLINEIQNSFKNDNRIDNKELKQLKELINNSDLSDELKGKVTTFLNHANDASKTFFGLFPSKISESELNSLRAELDQLKEIVKPLEQDNQLAKDLVDTIDKSLPTITPNQDNNQTNTYNSHDSNPVSDFLSKIFSGFSNKTSDTDNKPVNNSGNLNNNTDKLKSAHLSQFASGLPSQNGDCGPTSGAMVLRLFGFDNDIKDVRNNAPGKPSGPPWALNENQITRSVSKLSNGQVKVSAEQTYNPKGDANAVKEKLVSDIKRELAQGNFPMLCMGTGDYTNEKGTRHYTVVTGVDDKGNLQILDPAVQPNNYGAVSVSPEKFMENILSTRNANIPSISLTSFAKA
ncbi:MAG: C39 family peptidase [Candidatus Sericytochromatia bacterium]